MKTFLLQTIISLVCSNSFAQEPTSSDNKVNVYTKKQTGRMYSGEELAKLYTAGHRV